MKLRAMGGAEQAWGRALSIVLRGLSAGDKQGGVGEGSEGLD